MNSKTMRSLAVIKTKQILSSVVLFTVTTISTFAATIQNFEGGAVAPGSTTLALLGCPTPGLYGEGTYSIGGSSSSCHSLWASVGAQSGSKYMIVNGSTGVSNVYQQTIAVTAGLNSVFSGYFTGLYSAGPASLQLRVYNGTSSTGTVAAQLQFTTSVNPPTPSPLWALQSLAFVPTGSQVTVQVYNTSVNASGNDFGIDTLDVSQFGAALVQTPEPATFLLAGAALLAIGIRRKA
jgi:hypothetical protein